MSIYVKQFDTVGNSAFSKLKINPKGGPSVVAGNLASAACLMALDVNGQVLSQLEYVLTDGQISFISCIEIPNGYLIFGERTINDMRKQALVVRIDDQGNVVWSKTYGNPNTILMPIGMLPASTVEGFPDTFLFVNRINQNGDFDDVELIKINLKGTVLASKIWVLQLDRNSALNLSLFPGGAAIFGGTSEANGYKAFFLGFDFGLKLNYRKLLGNGIQQQLLDINTVGNQLLATGWVQFVKPPIKKTRIAETLYYSFLFKFDTKFANVTAQTFDLMEGLDFGIRKLINDADKNPNHYLFAAQEDAGSVAAKFDGELNLQWVKRLNIPQKHFIADAVYSSSDNEMVLSGWAQKTLQKSPLIFRTDKEYTTCITLQNPKPPTTPFVLQFEDWLIVESPNKPLIADLALQKLADPVPNRFICPENLINLNGLVQSPYLYLQAVGSDQTDDSSKGIHLRWRFQKSLGNHLAKGNYADPFSPYFTNIGFNKPNDFVKIYRAPYTTPYLTKVPIKDNVLPTQEIKSGSLRVWQFNNLALSTGSGSTNVQLRFKDLAQYDSIRSTMSTLQPEAFMKQYKGILEVEPIDKSFFSAQFTVAYNAGTQTQAYLRAEAVTFDDPADANSIFVACRKKFTGPTQLSTAKITGESLRYLRLDYSIAYVSEIFLETYFDFISNTKSQSGNNAWELLNNFALTLDTSIAFDRLENKNNAFIPTSKKYTIDKQWNKYNSANATTGEFKIKIDNYKHRWYPVATPEHPTSKPEDGIQKAVQEYLYYSKTDPKATAYLPVEDPSNLAKIEISYFDVLRLVGLDFHAARMLGLGHIDADIANPNTQFVYLMAYTSKGPLEPGNPPGLTLDHLHMSLPTSLKDHRLPPVPVQLPVTYGMAKDLGFGVMDPLTDSQGYVPLDNVRFINLNRDAYPYEKPFGAFFADPSEFSLSTETIPVKYGLEYKEKTEAAYRKPEIIQDDEYYDHAGINEVVEIPERGKNPLYLHQERETGEHVYGLYAINWFSRVSPVSNPTTTDYTQFKKVKSLLPPANFAVQLIQPEESLLLTTSQEQTRLSKLTGPDQTLLRVTFDWNHNHNVNYPFAERAQFFYRDAPADSIRGEVVAVTQLTNNKVQVKVKEFNILSTNPIETIAPSIPVGTEQKFIGSLFACGQYSFVIDQIYNSGSGYPEFVLNQVKQTESSDPLNNNQMVTIVHWLKPQIGDRFLIAENLAVPNNWSTQLQRMVYLEKFHTNDVIWLENTGTANNGKYRLEQVIQTGSNTNLVLLDKLKNEVVAGNIRYELVYRAHAFDPLTKKISIKGNVAGLFAAGSKLRLFGSSYLNDQDYLVQGPVAYNSFSNISIVTLSGNISDAKANFTYVAIERTAPILALNRKTKTVTVSGALASIIKPPYIETKIEYDGSLTKLCYGGLYLPASIDTKLEVIDNGPDMRPSYIHIGAYTVTFNNNYALPPHIDPSIEWHKGIIRILEDKPNPNRKSLQVWDIVKDANGNIKTPLELIVFDPDFAQNPIEVGNDVKVNFHPSYRLYLRAEFNANNTQDATHQFNAANIMPALGEGSKMTYMGVRSIDRFKQPPFNNIVQYDSYIAPLVPVLAREIIKPELIDIIGPRFATRPNFYGKSTYTIDLKLNTTGGRKPYGVLAYRGSETQILGTLYSDSTLFKLLQEIEILKSSAADRAAYFTMLSNLVHAKVGQDKNDLATYGKFLVVPNSIHFEFPLPDNPDYTDPIIKIKPFSSPILITTLIPPGDKNSQHEIVKRAIIDSFLSLTEQPVTYQYVKDGLATAGHKPNIRNKNGDLITPVLPGSPNPDGYDPSPMAVKFTKNGNEFYIRFTDFSLDGASLEYYFYYACEITNQLMIGEVENFIGPVLMVNTAPTEAPGIREVRTILANPLTGDVASVFFNLNKYNASEGITQFWVYRAYDAASASNIRSMKLAKKVKADQAVIDDFSDLPHPPFGETLFYKIVAIRTIKNELSLDEDILSFPSRLVQTTIVDVINPLAPKLFAENGLSTPLELQNVVLKWPSTTYNGTYYLQKHNSSGNWEEVYRIKVKEGNLQYPPLDSNGQPDFANFPKTQKLSRKDKDGNAMYHRFRVQVENSSGLFNLSESIRTLAKGATDLQETDRVLSYNDGTNHQLMVLSSTDIVSGASQPDQMTFTHRNTVLPAGHNNFVKIEVKVSDDLDNSFTQTINTPGGNVVFHQGDGGLILDATQPNRAYSVQTKLYTDFAPDGAIQVFSLNYLAGPCYDLKHLKNLINITDSSHKYNPALVSNINDGVSCPTFLQVSLHPDLLALGQTLVQTTITLKDNLGNTTTKVIAPNIPHVVFDHQDPLALDTSNPNRTYEIQLKISTLECPIVREENYRIFYSCSPADELAKLKNIAQFTDNKQTSLVLTVGQNLKAFGDPNGQITIQELVSGNLPKGHHFESMDVLVEDDRGGKSVNLPIDTIGGSVTFPNPGGNLSLVATEFPRVYFITLTLYTNLCPDGYEYIFTVKY